MMPKHAGPAPPIGPPADRSSDAERPVVPARADASLSTSRSLVVVSNRLPFTVDRRPEGVRIRRSPGGLVAALEPALAQRGGVWVGWTGAAREDDDTAAGAPPAATENVQYRAVPLTAHEIALYYAGFANRTIWPLFHYFVGQTQIDSATWRAYERVNERFAQVAADASDDEALVWVHDYQLLRVPHHLRRLAPRRRIAFFLHIPFPAADVLRVLPWSRDLIQGMLAADLVGVHIPSYADHVLTCAERLLGCEVDRGAGLVRFEGREVSVEAHPISIDVAEVERLAEQAARGSDAPDTPVAEILGVDRLDYTKGIHERMLAVERLLERHPGLRRRIAFTQVMVPSRERVAEYGELKREIDETVGRINGRFSERGWSPIRYLVRSLPPAELVALYRQADVALVTPLHDHAGPLTPIVPRPEDAQRSEARRQTLDQAARTPNLDIVIVSGRALADLQQRVGVPGLTYVGNHGFEIEGPGISFRHDELERWRAALEAAAAELDLLTASGARVERKGASVAFHVRTVPEGERRRLERQAEALLRRRRLRVSLGKGLIEGRPPVPWDKGHAVLHVLVHRHGADWPSRVSALYVGDDRTDEDAFRSLEGIGRSIRVGPSAGGARYPAHPPPPPPGGPVPRPRFAPPHRPRRQVVVRILPFVPPSRVCLVPALERRRRPQHRPEDEVHQSCGQEDAGDELEHAR